TPTSDKASAPSRASKPPSTHTPATSPKEGTFSAIDCGFLKMPEPITVPTTRAVAMNGPKARTSPGRSEAGEMLMVPSLGAAKRGCKRSRCLFESSHQVSKIVATHLPMNEESVLDFQD